MVDGSDDVYVERKGPLLARRTPVVQVCFHHHGGTTWPNDSAPIGDPNEGLRVRPHLVATMPTEGREVRCEGATPEDGLCGYHSKISAGLIRSTRGDTPHSVHEFTEAERRGAIARGRSRAIARETARLAAGASLNQSGTQPSLELLTKLLGVHPQPTVSAVVNGR